MTGDPCVLCEAHDLLEDLRSELGELEGWDHEFIEDMLIRDEEGMDKISDLQMHHIRRIHGERF